MAQLAVSSGRSAAHLLTRDEARRIALESHFKELIAGSSHDERTEISTRKH
jgi:hypothetical protein